jgi:hypothetical protein
MQERIKVEIYKVFYNKIVLQQATVHTKSTHQVQSGCGGFSQLEAALDLLDNSLTSMHPEV